MGQINGILAGITKSITIDVNVVTHQSGDGGNTGQPGGSGDNGGGGDGSRPPSGFHFTQHFYGDVNRDDVRNGVMDAGRAMGLF